MASGDAATNYRTLIVPHCFIQKDVRVSFLCVGRVLSLHVATA